MNENQNWENLSYSKRQASHVNRNKQKRTWETQILQNFENLVQKIWLKGETWWGKLKSGEARKGEKSSLDFETVHEDWVKPGLPSSTLASVPRSFAAQCRDSRTGSGLVTLCSPVLDAFLSSSVSSFFPNSSFVKCFSNFYQIFCIQILQIFFFFLKV